MEEEFLFGKLDCNDPEYIAALEKALEEKSQRLKNEREKKAAISEEQRKIS